MEIKSRRPDVVLRKITGVVTRKHFYYQIKSECYNATFMVLSQCRTMYIPRRGNSMVIELSGAVAWYTIVPAIVTISIGFPVVNPLSCSALPLRIFALSVSAEIMMSAMPDDDFS